MKKQRLDKLLLERGLVSSREKAQALIMAGDVFLKDQRLEKPGQQVPIDAQISLRQTTLPYVSRGGLKLEYGLDHFSIQVEGKLALDVGSSTGGFTDCLLQHGIREVYAIDVGYGQMDFKIAHHPKVHLKERINIRYVIREDFPWPFDLITIDVSFISLRLVLPVVKNLLAKPGEIVALVKPQFEVGKGQVGKGGIVRDPQKHKLVLQQIIQFAQAEGLSFSHLAPSPIAGAKGNQEFLLHLTLPGEMLPIVLIEQAVEQVIDQAKTQAP